MRTLIFRRRLNGKTCRHTEVAKKIPDHAEAAKSVENRGRQELALHGSGEVVGWTEDGQTAQ